MLRIRIRSGVAILAALVALGALAACEGTKLAEVQAPVVLPTSFSDHAVAAVPSPSALAFTPDGRLLVTTRLGAVRVIANGVLKPLAALDLATKLCTTSERGLLGLAIDPQFATNGFIYVYYTFNKFGICANNVIGISPVNRVSRFTYNLTTDVIAPASELVLVDNILSLNGNNNGGDLQIGADGMLYIAVGDSGCQIGAGTSCAGANQNAKFKSHLNGKILRVNRTDGTPPSDNPFFSATGSRRCGTLGTLPDFPNNDTKPCREIWSYGLRNPLRFAFQPGTSSFFINDAGQTVAEEIDENVRGANYGWNTREGFCPTGTTCTPSAPPAGLTDPVYAYGRSEGCGAISGGAFVPAGAWDSAFDGDYLFADRTCGKIFRLERTDGAVSVGDFATELGASSVGAMRFGPGPDATQSLYYTTSDGGGAIRRIDYTVPVNVAPTAVIAATPTNGPAPLAVTFDGSASSDPDPGDSIATYRWTFGDGETQDTTAPTVSHTYATPGSFTATLNVIDTAGAISEASSTTIAPEDTPPTVTITSPSSSSTFGVGEVVTLSATATDLQDGTLPATALTWVVVKRRAEQSSSFFGPALGNDLSITTDPPDDLLAAEDSFLEVRVTATDSSGLSTTVTQHFLPAKVDLTFQTSPPGLQVILDHTVASTGPSTVRSWRDWRLHARAPDQVMGGVTYTFQSWSDGGAREHDILTPATAATYTATFAPVPLFEARINFQPATSPVPAGYVADSGAVFGARGNGLSYGWNAVTDETRDRGNPSSFDDRYDTLDHMQKPSNPNAVWELAVPNGTYRVHIVSGDPDYFDSVFRVLAESTLVVNGTPTNTTRWIAGVATITVTDGRLTLSNASGAENNKLCFIDVTQL